MQPIRLLCCSLLLLSAIAVHSQVIRPGEPGNLGQVGKLGDLDELNIDSPADGQKVTSSVQFSISHTAISPGLALDLRCVRNGTGETKFISGPTFPDGGIPGLWPPCADFAVGGPFPDGTYTCTARIYDMQTNATIFSDVIQIVLDKTAPVASISLNPDKGCYNNGDTNVQFSATATDASGFSSWSLTGNGIANESHGAASSPLNVNRTINMALLADGIYTIQFEVADAAGFLPPDVCKSGPNVTVRTLEFTVDSTAPDVNVQSPGSCLRGTVNFNWTVNNSPPTTALVDTKVYVDGVLKATLLPTQTTLAFDTATLADGNHSLRVEVRDECGNVGFSQSAFSTDNTDPVITVVAPVITDPSQCKLVKGPTVAISFTISEASNWTITVDGGTTGLNPTNGSGTSGSVQWTPGDFACHDFLITATDACGNQTQTRFRLQQEEEPPGDCECVILPNLIWRGNLTTTDPFDNETKRTFRPEVINLDGFTIRDILNCHGVTFDENLIIQAVDVRKVTPLYKCGAFVYGPGSDLNTNWYTLAFATSSNIDDSVVYTAYRKYLGNRSLLFSPPGTCYELSVTYVIRDPNTGRTGPPITKVLCWCVEMPDKDVIRANIEYFSTVAAGRTQKPKIPPHVAQALNDALDIPNDLDALIAFEQVIGMYAVDFRTFIGADGKRDVRWLHHYLIDSDEEPIGCLLIEQANSLLWHP